ncbi:hypothetical protein ARMGADRAFT_356449 [Armillaria gallica]|uniref:Uncharacterized protein n=1 Tax=Armillaria gallica TaxID=47427 RepID=A0A2H3D4R2_ARMGA|nr:hypothetical protein ARMGADRAFT_356449 [Armillaria gallica]
MILDYISVKSASQGWNAISLELRELDAKVASENIALAGSTSPVEIIIGSALSTLAKFSTLHRRR